MAKPIHSMIRVLQEARSVDFYRRALGLEVIDRLPFDGFTLLYLRAPEGPFELELTVNHDRTQPYDLGDGYGHLAVVVEDLEAEHARMTQAGIEPGPIRDMAHQGRPMARYFFITDPDGYRTEVLQHFGRYA
ncbi:VOC family protein [Roseicella aquatilis]|uniref:Aldoketomutase n=1 Tax=Roseicella aquatilis TaxID=2527868 RepID=A0A4R4D7G2_9PROT|nr:VOC family protein [Roseicella aquatilis]TCZ56284.1 lactoylglutathione lyase [Roseicella aquatilis]